MFVKYTDSSQVQMRKVYTKWWPALQDSAGNGDIAAGWSNLDQAVQTYCELMTTQPPILNGAGNE